MFELAGFTVTQSTLLFVLGGILLLNLVLLVLVILLSARLGKVFRGKKASDLEEVVAELVAHKRAAENFHKEAEETFAYHDVRIGQSTQKPVVVRFDAFSGNGGGGRQSFATALVSEDGDGMVLSSLYTRDQMRVYAKPVEKFTSSFELTDEERDVLTRAKKK